MRAAGSDVSERESFAPLATLHALSTQFATEPNSVERAISLLDQTIPDTQGQAARALIVRAAAATANRLGPSGLQFVLQNFDLIEPKEAATAAAHVGCALWKIDPDAVVGLLEDPVRRLIAERAIASLSTPALLEGASSAPRHLRVLLDARPDLGTEPGYWLLPDAWNADVLRRIAERPEIVPDAINAMICSERPSIHRALAAFGSETVLKRLVALLEGDADVTPDTARAWLSEACSDHDALARVLVDGSVLRAATLHTLALAVTPDQVPNDLGEDPWLVAVRRVVWSDTTPYLASLLLSRAFGRRSRSCAELIQLTFDTVYTTVESSTLPDDAGRLLDHRLYRSFLWPNWDRCLRIRQTTINAFVERGLDVASFAKVTRRDDVFALLVELATSTSGGRMYLKSTKNHLAHNGDERERQRIIKQALW